MRKRGRRRFAAALGLIPVIVGAAILIAGASNAASSSTALHGRMLNIMSFGGPDCGSVTGVCSSFTATGDIKGPGKVFVDTLPNADGITKAHTVITTKKGELRCTEQALFDLVGSDHAFVDLCLITGGTGIYAGATGYIQEVGTFDFVANLGQAEYFGKLVLAPR